jgi:hypothetical protein
LPAFQSPLAVEVDRGNIHHGAEGDGIVTRLADRNPNIACLAAIIKSI